MKRNGLNYHESIDDLDLQRSHQKTPETRLLEAILAAAIHEAINPRLEPPTIQGTKKRKLWLKHIRQFEQTSLTIKEYAELHNLSVCSFRNNIHRRQSLIQFEIEERRQMTGFRFIMEDERSVDDAWSFAWICQHLFEDDEGARTAIRKHILEHAKNLT